MFKCLGISEMLSVGAESVKASIKSSNKVTNWVSGITLLKLNLIFTFGLDASKNHTDELNRKNSGYLVGLCNAS